MKTVNKICQILAVLFGIVTLALFLLPDFATIVTDGTSAGFTAAQLSFGGKVTVAETEQVLAKSADILFCFILSVLGLVLSAFSFKSKTVRYFAPAVGLVTAIYMLVIALSSANKFVDTRALVNVGGVSYTAFALILAISLFVFTAAAAAHLFVDDYIEVKQSKGSKRTILKRVILFFRDYKSEVKKIVWPGIKDVLKNTLIVLIMCLIIGLFVWLIDLGLGKLINDVILK